MEVPNLKAYPLTQGKGSLQNKKKIVANKQAVFLLYRLNRGQEKR